MRRKLPDCPRCGLDELWLKYTPMFTAIACYECGWDAIMMPPPAAKELNGAVAAAVAAARVGGSEASP